MAKILKLLLAAAAIGLYDNNAVFFSFEISDITGVLFKRVRSTISFVLGLIFSCNLTKRRRFGLLDAIKVPSKVKTRLKSAGTVCRT